MWIQKWHQTNIVFWKWLWAMAKSIQHLCISRFSVTFRTTSNDSATWDNGQLEIWPHLFPKILEISWDDMHVSSHMFHCVSFMIVHYSTTLFIFVCHDFTTLLILFSRFHHMFHVFFAFSHMFHGFLRKKTPPSLLRHPLCFSVSLHAGGVQQAPAERATTGGATKALREAVSAEPWKRETMVGRRGFPHTLWLCQNSYWKWPFLVDFPIKHGDFP